MQTIQLASLLTVAVGVNAVGFIGMFGLPPSDTDTTQTQLMTNKQWFCHKLDCPAYVTMANNTGYEKRRYEATKWVATNVTTDNYSAENSRLFFKLFHYIDGHNSAGHKIPMTSPVLRREVMNPGAPSTHIMYFMVPHDMQDSTPSPTDPTVYLVTLPPMTVYVGSYSGYSSMVKDEDAFRVLRAELGTTPFSTGYTFTAGYDGPYTLTTRHNEVWIPV